MPPFISHILDLLFPKKDSVVALEHRGKKNQLRELPPAPETPEPWMRAIFAYKDPAVRELVWEIKYSGNQALLNDVGGLMAEEIMSFFEERGSFVSSDWALIPIPASKEHAKDKGFSQTEELCEAIMRNIAKPSLFYSPSTLYKIKETMPQTKMKKRGERLHNLINCYAIKDASFVSGKNFIIIDDVATTGSTLFEARRALKVAGAKKVIALTVAH